MFNPAPGGGASGAQNFGVYPGTVISDVSPSSFVPTGKGFTLSVFGLNFLGQGGSAQAAGERHMAGESPTVLWNGQPLATVVVSSTELQAEVPANLVGTSGQATVTVSGGGSGASNVVPLPITVTQPTPLLSVLSPGSAVPGSGRLALALEGRNFVEGAKVLWNGQERETEFVNSTRLQAIIPEGDIAAVGASRVSVLNPAPGGGESNGEMFNIVETLLYPRLASIPRSGGGAVDDSEFTGIGFTNLGDKQAKLTLTAFDQAGALISGSGITNPAQVQIDAGHQIAVVDWQIFGEALTAQKPLGWFKTESLGSGLVGFFLMFNHTTTKLDGADVSARTGGSFVAPVIEERGFTQLHVVNPDVQPAEVLFELYGADGTVRAPAEVRTLAPNAAVVEYVSELFAGVTATASDYVRVVSNRGVLLFEYLGRPGQDVKGLNGQDAAGGSTVLYSPQYAVGGDWATELTVVNLEERSGVVSMRLIGDNGSVLAGPVQQAIGARGKLQITDQDLFVDSGGGLRQGYVEVRSDGVKLAGSVVFGARGGNSYTAALPLVSELETDMVFSQLASDERYYTGLAILNPNAQAVMARVEVYDENGVLIAGKDEVIAAGGRVSKLLTQYFGELAGQSRSQGYIRVRTNLGVASYVVFGTWPGQGNSLSAVPPQRVVR
ncbi:MAG: cell surface receptor domain protein [Acidobacteria bacterium]|nr:cell surface receptor domain protein [Acidobacteriota bacterium]